MQHSFTNPIKFIFLLLAFLLNSFAFAAKKPVRVQPATSQHLSDPLNVAQVYLNGESSAGTEPDTVRVMALRLQFSLDSLKTTTGDGHFDLSNESQFVIDPPPHNKSYFEQQLLALRNYFFAASNGKLVIEYTVFPPADDDAYQAANNMVYYSGEEDEAKQKLRWAELLQEAVNAAARQDKPDFSRFDAFVVFHAGVGKDFAFDFTDTPFDIQSAYLDFATLQETIGDNDPNYQGIAAGDKYFVRNGIILPEQQSQKEITLGLLGTATLLMGSQIGMPSLYQTETGRAGIGTWGLMDQGSYNYFGLVPALPSAWEKLFMGWENAVTVTGMEQAVLGASETTSAPHLIKVPITSTEYFLLENRQEDVNGDRITYGHDENGVRVKFDSLGNIVAEQGLGVITHVDEYDYGLPGSGILIWHIDDNVIRANLSSNTINNDPNHRGVDLVECDGPQDIGQKYGMFTPGYGTEAGDYWDAFWSGNVSHKYINGDNPVEFSSTSIPASYGYGRLATHIRIYNFSDKDTLMTCSIGNDWHAPGFPQYTGRKFGEGALTRVELDDGSNGVIAVAKNGDLLGWRLDGGKIIANDLNFSDTDVAGRTTEWPLALMAQVGHPVSLPPTIVDYKNDGSDDILVVDENGGLTIWATLDKDGDGRADLLKSMSFDETLTCMPNGLDGLGSANGNFYDFVFDNVGNLVDAQKRHVADDSLSSRYMYQGATTLELFATTHGRILAYSVADGAHTLQWSAQAFGNGNRFYLASASAGSVVNGVTPLVVLSNDGYITLLDENGAALNSERKYVDAGVTSAPAIGDVDNDGEPEILFAGETRLYSIELTTGALTLNYPVEISNSANAQWLAAPLWMDAADGSHAIVATANGRISSFGDKGRMNKGFPLPLGSAVSASPLLIQNGAARDNEFLFALSNDGFLYAWNLNQKAIASWPQFGGNSSNSFYYDKPHSAAAAPNELMPKKKVFCYPNPSEAGRTFIRYTLTDAVDHVNIQIFDIAGATVTRIDDGGILAGDHEVIWDVSAVQSGAYIARVEAQSTNGNVVEFIKIAVVK